jgi:hypothetical protein
LDSGTCDGDQDESIGFAKPFSFGWALDFLLFGTLDLLEAVKRNLLVIDEAGDLGGRYDGATACANKCGFDELDPVWILSTVSMVGLQWFIFV